jgi:putative secretion ATPase (PEP-CTERM system associated)
MYERFFNLTAEPFRLSPDHHFCYNHTQYAKAKAYMAYAFMRAEGFVMVTGKPGTGKTTLIGDLVESLAGEDVVVANLVSTQLAADDLVRMVAFAFGVDAQEMDKSTILQQLTTRFLTLYRESGRALLIVDEAQDLTASAMEELRLLTNLQQDGKPLLQIFLLGQPELRDLIHDQRMEQVHQRIIAASHLQALKEDETRAYVEHRLKVVGWANDPAISAAVFPIIYLFSEGVPRRINLICSRLFLHCCVELRHQITVADARTVVEELQEEQLSTRNLLSEDLFFAADVFDEPLPQEALVAATETRARTATGGTRRSNDAVESGPVSVASPDAPAGESVAELQPVVAEAVSNVSPQGIISSSTQNVEHDVAQVGLHQQSAQKPEISLHKGGGNGVNIGLWLTLVAVLVAGGVVAFLVGIDRFM